MGIISGSEYKQVLSTYSGEQFLNGQLQQVKQNVYPVVNEMDTFPVKLTECEQNLKRMDKRCATQLCNTSPLV